MSPPLPGKMGLRRQYKLTRSTTCYDILPHTNTTKHHQTHHPFPAQIQAHFIPSGTRLAQLYQDSCFVHDAEHVRPTRNGPRSMHSGPQGKSELVRTQREPTGRAIIVIVTEREREEKEKRQRTKEENDGREKEEKTRGWYTRKRFECTHGDVWNLHTEDRFSACHAAPHTDTTDTRHHTTNTHHTLHTRMLGPRARRATDRDLERDFNVVRR